MQENSENLSNSARKDFLIIALHLLVAHGNLLLSICGVLQFFASGFHPFPLIITFIMGLMGAQMSIISIDKIIKYIEDYR